MEIRSDSANELFDDVIAVMSNSICYDSVSDNDNEVVAEIINANLVLFNPYNNMMNSQFGRNMSIKYAIGELLWYNSCNPRASAIYPYSKYWTKLADEDGHVNSNYGFCIHNKFNFDQWTMCKYLLRKDRNTRQAVIHIKEPVDLRFHPTKDLNCTLSLQFFIRDEKLDLIVTMRSNDVWLGLPYDVFNFTCMQIQMAMELGVEVGTYYHNSGSLHLYKKNLNAIKRILETNIRVPKEMDTCNTTNL